MTAVGTQLPEPAFPAAAATHAAVTWARLLAFSLGVCVGVGQREGDEDSSDSASTSQWQKLTGSQQAGESGKCSLQVSGPRGGGRYRRRGVGLTEEDPIQRSTSLTVKPKFTMTSQESTPSPQHICIFFLPPCPATCHLTALQPHELLCCSSHLPGPPGSGSSIGSRLCLG